MVGVWVVGRVVCDEPLAVSAVRRWLRKQSNAPMKVLTGTLLALGLTSMITYSISTEPNTSGECSSA